MTDWSKIVEGEDLISASKQRMAKAEQKKVDPDQVSALQEKGWEPIKTDKKGKVLMSKEKRYGDQFENEVWMIFYKMGFQLMNSDNSFEIDLNGNTKQIDIIAMDEDTCVLIECKATKVFEKSCSFKQELESIHGYYADACKKIEEKYGKKHFKFIFATKNYLITDDSMDMQRINSFGYYYMSQDTVEYYEALVEHLGSAAKYQLLGNLFHNEVIDGLETKIPALKGRMGGLEYYSFLIEPDKLLRIAYILHRSKANHLLMPTYQRLIKKERLTAIRNFVNEGGYFPNSLIVSIDNAADDVKFDLLGKVDSDISETGILSLPARYRSVYVIDGQHRLYGYSETQHATTNVIPVVAFVNLPSEKQVQMFMEINENQKKVSKTLRNTLNIDLLWESNDPNKRKDALMLRTAEALGEEGDSPLYARVVTGEDKVTTKRCITTDYVKDAIKHSSFLNEYGKKGITKNGSIDRNDNDVTYPALISLLKKGLTTISDYCSDEWELGSDGFLAINNAVYGLIRIIDDVISIQFSAAAFPLTDIDAAYEKCEPMLLELCEAINEMNEETRMKIKKAKGGGAKKEAWRVLQVALNSKDPQFTSKDLVEYIENNCTDNNPESAHYLSSIEAVIKSRFKDELFKDPNWMINKLPEALASDIVTRAAAENFKRSKFGQEVIEEWDIISFEEISKICIHGNNWSSFAQALLSRPSEKSSKINAVSWLKDLANFKLKIKAGKPITRNEFETLKELYNDFCNETNI